MKSPVRVRFAPSPTGTLHIGGVRTALFNYLFAKKNEGSFLIRIEDTDLERSSQHFTDDILQSLDWLGLYPDEPLVYQHQRMDLYRQKAYQLVDHGAAYVCQCSSQEVDQMREQAISQGKKPQYDRRCRELKLPIRQKDCTIRAKFPMNGSTLFEDLIKGPVEIQNQEVDDFVLLRSTGDPLYNLSVVVDDGFSEITHVLRGEDHINNTPKQIFLYQALGLPVPQFGHFGMILGADKKKLSKRHGATSTHQYRLDGFLPEALLNFLVRLGWSHGNQEVFTLKELTHLFSLEQVQKSPAVFNPEKLLWLNAQHLKMSTPSYLLTLMQKDFSDLLLTDSDAKIYPHLLELIPIFQSKVKRCYELAQHLAPFCIFKNPAIAPTLLEDMAWDLKLGTALQEILNTLRPQQLEKTLMEQGVDSTQISEIFKKTGQKFQKELGSLAKPCRIALSGKTVSAGVFEMMAVLPWNWVESRIQNLVQLMQSDC